MKNTNTKASDSFLKALELQTIGYFNEALVLYNRVSKEWPNSHLADDALYNSGICHMQLGRLNLASEVFDRVVEEYPTADLYTDSESLERGKTAAKAIYSKLNCMLQLGKKKEDLIKEIDRLKRYQQSYIYFTPNKKQTFFEAANELIQ